MPDIAAVLWDMDGVIVDTGAIHFETWKTVLDELGIPFDQEKFTRIFGRNNRDTLSLLLGQPPSSELLRSVTQAKEGAFRKAVPERVRLLPGVLTWLKIFQQHGLPQAIASSAPPENITAVVEAVNISGFFAAFVPGYDLPGKPEPDVFLEAARQLNTPPSACLVIEDTPAGVAAARAAGMTCFAVCTTHPPETLQAAHRILPSLESLREEDLFP